MIAVTDLPALNAALNLTATFLLGIGYYFIRQRKTQLHKACMMAALGVSALFLISYLTYHYNVGSVRFTHTGWVRPVYFAILITHILLAFAVPPMALRTVWLAYQERFQEHVRLARWTFPIWMYVSITGVIVYLMLYRM